jgi:hypothetical protein
MAISAVGSIYIPDYSKRERGNYKLIVFLTRLRRRVKKNPEGLTLELEVTRDRKRLNLLKFVESNFDQNPTEVAKVFSEDLNTEFVTLAHVFLGSDTYVPVHDITVEQLQKFTPVSSGRDKYNRL